eukprot:6456547-Amphidinium_carterae.2
MCWVIAGMDSCEDAESYKAWIRDIPAGAFMLQNALIAYRKFLGINRRGSGKLLLLLWAADDALCSRPSITGVVTMQVGYCRFARWALAPALSRKITRATTEWAAPVHHASHWEPMLPAVTTSTSSKAIAGEQDQTCLPCSFQSKELWNKAQPPCHLGVLPPIRLGDGTTPLPDFIEHMYQEEHVMNLYAVQRKLLNPKVNEDSKLREGLQAEPERG